MLNLIAFAVAQTIAPISTFYGDNSHVTKPAYNVIASEATWKTVYATHVGKPVKEYQYMPPPVNFDFTKYDVIAIFGGSGWNSHGITAKVEDMGKELRVRFDHYSYQTAGPDGGGVRVKPYGFFVIPKSGKPVVFEENVQSYIGEPPVWKFRAKVSAK